MISTANLRAIVPARAVARVIAGFLPAFIIILATSTAFGQNTGKPIIISERVGQNIDSMARRYFGLFPGVGHFSSASVVDGSDTTVNFIVKRRLGDADTILTAPKGIIAELRRYVDHYEGLFGDDTTSIDWIMLNGIAQPVNPFLNEPLTLAIRAVDGSESSGTVLYADSNAIVIGISSEQRYGDRSTMPSIHILVPSDIAEVRDTRSFGAHRFSEIDIPVAGNDTMYWREIFPAIKDHVLYAPIPPPEITKAIHDYVTGKGARGMASATMEELEQRNPPNRFHAGILYGIIAGHVESDYLVTTFNAGNAHAVAQGPGSGFWGVTADYSLSRRLRAGLAFMIQGMAGTSGDSTDDYERYSGDLIAGTMKFVVIPSGRYLTNPLKRIEFSIGLGVAMQLLTIEQRITSPFSNLDTTSDDHRTATGGVGTIAFGYYLSPNLTINFEDRFIAFPSQDVAKHELQSLGGTGFVLRAHEAYSLALNTNNLLVGIGYHF